MREKEEKESLIAKQEEHIRSNHDEHEKKMHEVAKFNRLHEKAKANDGGNGVEPTEAKMAELEKESQELAQSTKKFEGMFIKKQSQLITREIKCNNLGKENYYCGGGYFFPVYN